MKPSPLALFVVTCLAACSSSNDGGSPATQGDADADTATAADMIDFTMHVKVPPGTEVHRCELIKMPKSDDGGEIFIGGRSHDYTPGSHHYLVYRTDLDSIPAELSTQVDCFEGTGMMKHQRGFIAAGQTPTAKEDLPEGVALAFKSEEVLLFQAHYVNAKATELDATVNLHWRRVPKESVVHRAGVTNFYNPFIYVPAKGASKAPMRCPIPKDVTLLGGAPHMHKRGVFYEAFLDEPGKTAAEPFYTTDDWEHPEPWLGPVEVKAGSFLRFECAYENLDDRTYIQGQSADDNEMCMFLGTYYPELGLEENRCFPGMDMHGTGTLTCTQVGECARACPPGAPTKAGVFPPDISECVQKCVTESCPSASGPFLKQLTCLQSSCAEPCVDSTTDACRACMTEKCLAEASACLTHTCE